MIKLFNILEKKIVYSILLLVLISILILGYKYYNNLNINTNISSNNTNAKKADAIKKELIERSMFTANYYKSFEWSTENVSQEVYETSLVLKIMNNVRHLLEPERYSVINKKEGLNSINNLDKQVIKGAGLCGAQINLFVELTRKLGFESRSIEFYDPYTSEGHVGAEIKIMGKWKYFDVTWGAVFRNKTTRLSEKENSFIDFLSIDEIVNNQNFDIIANEGNFIYLNNIAKKNKPFRYAKGQFDILKGKEGLLNYFFDERNMLNTKGKPDYIGVTQDRWNGEFGNLSWKINLPSNIESEFEVEIHSSFNNCKNSKLLVNKKIIQENTYNIFKLNLKNKKNNIIIKLNRINDEICYYYIDQIRLVHN